MAGGGGWHAQRQERLAPQLANTCRQRASGRRQLTTNPTSISTCACSGCCSSFLTISHCGAGRVGDRASTLSTPAAGRRLREARPAAVLPQCGCPRPAPRLGLPGSPAGTPLCTPLCTGQAVEARRWREGEAGAAIDRGGQSPVGQGYPSGSHLPANRRHAMASAAGASSSSAAAIRQTRAPGRLMAFAAAAMSFSMVCC